MGGVADEMFTVEGEAIPRMIGTREFMAGGGIPAELKTWTMEELNCVLSSSSEGWGRESVAPIGRARSRSLVGMMEEERSEAAEGGTVEMLGVDAKGKILLADDVERMVDEAPTTDSIVVV